jgi:hypothetical protein
MNTSQVIVADATALIAKGKSAVEGAIGDISKAEQEAAAYIKNEKSKVVAALNGYLATHSAEVSAAQDLLAKAGATLQAGAASVVPAATLAASTPGGFVSKLKVFAVNVGWKGWVLIAVCVGALKELHTHGVI